MMARPEKTPRQSVTERKFCKGVVAPNAPNPPATICKPFIIGSRSLWNQITKALKAAIKHAETPNPISNLPVINPEEVAELIEFLIADEASYITGQTIHINGGLYM